LYLKFTAASPFYLLKLIENQSTPPRNPLKNPVMFKCVKTCFLEKLLPNKKTEGREGEGLKFRSKFSEQTVCSISSHAEDTCTV